MRYKIALRHSDEGFSVSVPGLPGCWSQGDTEAEALANIQAAIDSVLDRIGAHRVRDDYWGRSLRVIFISRGVFRVVSDGPDQTPDSLC